MRPSKIALVAVFIGPLILAGPGLLSKAGQDAGPGQVSSNDRGLHGYISFDADSAAGPVGIQRGHGLLFGGLAPHRRTHRRFPDRPAERLDHARQLGQQIHAARPRRDLCAG